jgi:VanZ family protein
MILKLIPALTWACIIALLCLLPQTAFYNPGFLQKLPADKIIHFGMFFILSFLVWYGIQNKLPGFFNRRFLIILLILFSYGGITELAQDWLTKTRHTEFLDFLSDIAGVTLGFFFYFIILKRKTSGDKNLTKY